MSDEASADPSAGAAGPAGASGRAGPTGASASATTAAERARTTGARPEPLLAMLKTLWRELPGLVSDRIELLSLEVQRAGSALLQIVVLIVACAILGVTVWLAVWAVAVGLLVAVGLHWAVALLVVIAFNVVAIVWAVLRAKSLLPRMNLAATRRHLTLSPSTAPPQPVAAPTTVTPPGGQSAAAATAATASSGASSSATGGSTVR